MAINGEFLFVKCPACKGKGFDKWGRSCHLCQGVTRVYPVEARTWRKQERERNKALKDSQLSLPGFGGGDGHPPTKG